MRKLTGDEKVKRSTRVEGDRVIATFTVKANGAEATQTFVLEDYFFDMADVTDEEIRLAAAKAWIIERQRMFRDAGPTERQGLLGKGCKVRDLIDRERRGPDASKQAVNALDKLTQAERDAIFAQYKDPTEDDKDNKD